MASGRSGSSTKDVRNAVISTARNIIQAEGADRLSLREIARRIGYSPAGLYEYFENKEEIVQAVRLGAQERFNKALGQVPQTLPLAEYLVQLGLAYIRFANKYPQEFLLLFTYRRGHLDDTAAEQRLARESYALLGDAVERAVKAEEVHERAGFGVEEIAYGFWALAHGMAMLQVAYQRELSLEFLDADEMALRAFAHGLKQA